MPVQSLNSVGGTCLSDCNAMSTLPSRSPGGASTAQKASSQLSYNTHIFHNSLNLERWNFL